MSERLYPYEENAEPITPTVQAWKCRGCGKVYQTLHAASDCHAKDYPCRRDGCTNRANYHQGECRECNSKLRLERFLAMPEVDYDGGWIAEEDGDRFFRCEEDLLDHLNSPPDGGEVEDLLDVRLVACDLEPPPTFSIDKFLESTEYGDEDTDYPSGPEVEAIEKAVNDFLQKKLHPSICPTSKRIRIESLGIERNEEGEWDYARRS